MSDLYMPGAGEVIEIMDELNGEPELVNLNCYTAGWMVKVKLEDKSNLDALMNAADYKKFIVE